MSLFHRSNGLPASKHRFAFESFVEACDPDFSATGAGCLSLISILISQSFCSFHINIENNPAFLDGSLLGMRQ